MRDKNKQRAYGRAYYHRNKERKLASNKIWMQKNKEYRKGYSWGKFLNRKYGITIDQYNALFEIQKGCCAICGLHQENFKKKLYTDHNHETGKVRGLLCVNCNMLIGHAREKHDILLKSVEYLKTHELYR